MGGGGKIGDPKDLATGAVLQCVEAATLGMPFEVWKTRMGRFRNESTVEAFFNVYKHGGGASAFWRGLSAKLVESASKGAILLYAKEAILMGMVRGTSLEFYFFCFATTVFPIHFIEAVPFPHPHQS